MVNTAILSPSSSSQLQHTGNSKGHKPSSNLYLRKLRTFNQYLLSEEKSEQMKQPFKIVEHFAAYFHPQSLSSLT